MGCDASNYLPRRPTEAVFECLIDLGYHRVRVTKPSKDHLGTFLFFDREDYRSHTALWAAVYAHESGLRVNTRTLVWRSHHDNAHHNKTIRVLRDRFDGYFKSDFGRNRYLKYDGVKRTPSESGCFIAYLQVQNSLVKADLYLGYRNFPTTLSNELTRELGMDPMSLSNNMLRVFLVSCLEDYLKSTFVALLTVSAKKEVFLRGPKLRSEDLLRVSEGRLKIEEAVANGRNFQNLESAFKAFRELDDKLNFKAALSKPYRRRNRTLLVSLNEMVSARHAFIHENVVDAEYVAEVNSDLANLKVSIDRIYSSVLKHHGWHDERPC